MAKYLVMMDPIGIVASDLENILERQEIYLSRMNFLTDSGYHLIIVTRQCQVERTPPNIEIISIPSKTRFSPTFLFSAYRNLKPLKNQISLFIAGDPWETLLMTFLVKLSLSREIPIQAQLHADIGDPNWDEGNYIRKIRKYLFPHLANLASSFRFVSQGQLDRCKHLLNSKTDLVIAPVPSPEILLGESVGNHERTRAIGFLGRIHHDRGLEDFTRFAMAVKSRYPEVSVVVAGDGPSREEFLNALESIPIEVEYLGSISGAQKKVFWRKIGVLASFAPTESFGRSIRESLFNYTPVIAKESPQILELQRTFGEESIAILGKSPTENANKFATILEAQFSESDISVLKKEQVEAVNRLCDSWMRITN